MSNETDYKDCGSYLNGFCLMTGEPDILIDHHPCDSILSCPMKYDLKKLKAQSDRYKQALEEIQINCCHYCYLPDLATTALEGK